MELVARELGVSENDVREMESRMSAQDMAFDMTADDNDDSHPIAPVLFLEDKSSDLPTALRKITGIIMQRIN